MNTDYTIKSLDHLQGVADGVAYAMLNIDNIIIEEEKNFAFDVYENPNGHGFCLRTTFTDFFIEPVFKGDHEQPADDSEPHTQEQVFFIYKSTTVRKVVKDFLEELERISAADSPEDTISRQELKESFNQ